MQAHRKINDLSDRILMATDYFEHAASRGHFWHDISTGCDALNNVFREKDLQISQDDRDVLLRSIVKARMDTYGRLDFDAATADGRRIVLGFDALACLANYLAEDAFARSRRAPGFVRHFTDHARILQNVAHNYSLEEDWRSR